MKKYIEFYSYISFIFWLLPGMKKKKYAEIKFHGDSQLYFKTDIVEDSSYLINEKIVYFFRYFPILFILTIFGAFSIEFKIEYLYTIVLSVYTVFFIKRFFRNLYIYLIIGVLLILPFSFYIMYIESFTYFIYALLVTVKVGIGVYAIYSILQDFFSDKKYLYFHYKKGRIIQRIEK